MLLRRPLLAVTVLALATACGSTVQVTSTGQTAATDGLSQPTTSATTGGTTGSLTGGLTTGSTGGSGSTGSLVTGTTGTTGGGSAGGSSSTGGSTSTGSTGGTAGGTGATSGLSTRPSTSKIPTKGFGFDAKFVYIGVLTQKDVNTVAQSVGANGLDAGDQEGQTKAVLNYLNAHGGLFGRTIKPIFHDISTVGAAGNPASTGSSACTYFAQDQPVIAVLNPVTLIDVPAFRNCLAKAHIPVFSASVAATDAATVNPLAPYFYQSVAPTYDALAPVLVAGLKKGGYFTGWNATTGHTANTTPKVGILTPDTEDGNRVANLTAKALKSGGFPNALIYKYDTSNTSSSMNSAVLQFSANKVTHIIATDTGLSNFQTSAKSQNYKPRYGISSLNAPVTFLEENGGAAQNVGDIGVGWAPGLDVDDANDPGDISSGETLCRQVLKAGGQTFTGKRLALAVAMAFCDGLRLIHDAAVAGNGLSGPALYAGMQKIGPTFSTAFSFRSGLSAGRLFIPGGVRTLAFNGPCACFKYTSTTTLPL